VQARKLGDARRAIEGWLVAGCALCAVPIGLVAARAGSDLFGTDAPGLSLFDAYGLACFVRLGFDVYARTYHAGIFALRRVYRPLPALLGVDLLELAVITLGFDRYGAWIIPIAIGLAGAADALLGVHYAGRAYRRQRLPAPAPLRALRQSLLAAWTPRRPRRSPAAGSGRRLRRIVALLRTALLHSVANATLQLDALLLLLLVRVDPPRRGGASLALLYYVLRPLLGLATQWVRTFYFDLSRIERGSLRAFRPRLVRFLGRLALFCAGFGALLTLGVAELLWPQLATWSWLWLGPLFLTRSLFALTQLKAFTAGRYRALVEVSGALALGLGAIALAAHSGEAVLAGAALLLGLGAFALRERAAQASSAGPGEVLGVCEFLRELRASGHVQLAVLSVARRSAEVGRVVHALLALGPGVRLARHARSHVLLFAPAGAIALSRARLVAASGGVLHQLWLSAALPALDSIGLARAQAALPGELHDALAPNAPERGSEQLVADFRRSFPAGVLLDLEAGTGALDPGLLPRPMLGMFVHQVVAASHQRERELRARLPVQIAVYAPGGRASLVFVVAQHTAGFAVFRARVRGASLRASLYLSSAAPLTRTSSDARA
jgi:hypothetical protein